MSERGTIWQPRRAAVPELNFKRPRDRGGGPTGAALSLLYRGHEAHNGESTAMLLGLIPACPFTCLLACLPACLPACLLAYPVWPACPCL